MSFFSRIISSRWTGNLSRRWPYFVAAAVLVMGTAFSALLFALAYGWEHERIEQDFDRQSRDRVSALRKTIELNALEMLAVQSFYDGSDEVTRKEFEVFTAPLMAGHPSIRALQWAPRVLESQRRSSSKRRRATAFAVFRSPSAMRRDGWFPFPVATNMCRSSLSSRRAGNVIALGFDLATDPACLEAMELCRDSGKLTATSRILLPPDSGSPSEVRLFLPVYRRGATLETVEERRQEFGRFRGGGSAAGGRGGRSPFRAGARRHRHQPLRRLRTETCDSHVFASVAPPARRIPTRTTQTAPRRNSICV